MWKAVDFLLYYYYYYFRPHSQYNSTESRVSGLGIRTGQYSAVLMIDPEFVQGIPLSGPWYYLSSNSVVN